MGDGMLFIGNWCFRSWSGKGFDVDGCFTQNCIYYVPPSRSAGDDSEPPPSCRLWKFYVNEKDRIDPVVYHILFRHPLLQSGLLSVQIDRIVGRTRGLEQELVIYK